MANVVEDLQRGTAAINDIEAALKAKGVIGESEEVPVEDFDDRITQQLESMDMRVKIDNIRTALLGNPNGLTNPEANQGISVSGIIEDFIGRNLEWASGSYFGGSIKTDDDQTIYELSYNDSAYNHGLKYLYISFNMNTDAVPLINQLKLTDGFYYLEGIIIDCKSFEEKPTLVFNQLSEIKFMDAYLDGFNKSPQNFEIFIESHDYSFGNRLEYINPAFTFNNASMNFSSNQRLINYSTTNLSASDDEYGIASAPFLKRYIYSGDEARDLIIYGSSLEYIKGYFSSINLSQINPAYNELKLKLIVLTYTDPSFTLTLPNNNVDCSGLKLIASTAIIEKYQSDLDTRNITYKSIENLSDINEMLEL